VPCFLWIFLGAPYIERLRGIRSLSSALNAVTAAVVGVILNLAVWFGLGALFINRTSIDWFALAVAVVAFLGLVRWKWNLVWVVIAAGAVGYMQHVLIG
jgi:chromate transporter